MQKVELFNTHKLVKDLTNAGMKEKQAEIIADHQLAMLETHIATKADILDLKKDLAELKIQTKQDSDWIKRLLFGVGAIVAIAAFKYIFFH